MEQIESEENIYAEKQQILWSIKDEHQPSPLYSWMIIILGIIDWFIPRFGPLKCIPMLGGDIYELSRKGFLKFVMDKFNAMDKKETHVDVRFAHLPLSIIYDGKLARQILLSKHVSRGKMYDRLTEFFGLGIFTSKIHERWRHQRHLILQLFTKKNLLPLTNDLTMSMFKELDRQITKNSQVDMVTLLSQMGLVGFCEVVFGIEIDDMSTELVEPINRLLQYINGAVEPFIIKIEPSYQAFRKDKDFVHDWVKKIIVRAKASTTCHPLVAQELARTDASEIELVEFILSLVLGGHETTARLMLGIVYGMYHNEEILGKLNLETEKYLDMNEDYRYNILEEPYLKNIIREGSRLFSPVWILGRQTNQDIIVDNGPVFKKGTQFLIIPMVFLRSEKIWGPDAEIFNPDRFNNITPEQKNIFIPFVVGTENCPGKLFAELEASIVISKLFYHYDVKILDHKIRPTSAGTFRITDKLPVIIKKKII